MKDLFILGSGRSRNAQALFINVIGRPYPVKTDISPGYCSWEMFHERKVSDLETEILSDDIKSVQNPVISAD